MISFCENVTREIKLARSPEEIGRVLDNAMVLYRSTRGQSRESDFVIYMIVTLQVLMTENIPAQQIKNVKEAIAIFRQYQQKNFGQIL